MQERHLFRALCRDRIPEVSLAEKNVAMTLAFPASHSFLTTDEQSVDLFPMPPELTVAQAAIVLDIPEGGILEMLKLGILECKQAGTRRLIDRDELFAYKREREIGHAILDEIVRENQEMGLYDD